MTPDQRARATVLNDRNAMLGSRRIVNEKAGELVGKWVAPARLLEDPDYERWHERLSPLPRIVAEGDDLFEPPASEQID
ncbi:hypothetical protein FPY71_11535 [Aureimonas fodinaquatilis]|uniref:Uncharacterized protein n=2 Tax=Aureimonas fodinaquatilis TaxID=2565783 RepID=A0A5B0DZU8_9HYPH|nr:hypothetical protein FPY71_11535 [Aureimonas fodinaquatilis]